MKGCTGNPAAGTRHLGTRSHARLLDEQTEGLTRVLRADEITIEMARLLAALHTNLRAAERSLVSANERASAAIYEAPASMLLAVA